MLSNDSSRFYKLAFNTEFSSPKFYGQTAFGTEELRTNGEEAVYQKWCGVFENGRGLAVLNKGTYGGSVENNTLNISLLRTPVYSAHPIGNRPLTDSDRSHDRIDIGEREFSYRLTADTEHLDTQAEIFNQPCFALSFFPSGAGKATETSIELSNSDIILSRYASAESGTVIRLYNSKDCDQETQFSINSKSFTVRFTPFEVKTFIFDGDNLTETNMI